MTRWLTLRLDGLVCAWWRLFGRHALLEFFEPVQHQANLWSRYCAFITRWCPKTDHPSVWQEVPYTWIVTWPATRHSCWHCRHSAETDARARGKTHDGELSSGRSGRVEQLVPACAPHRIKVEELRRNLIPGASRGKWLNKNAPIR